MSLKVRDIMQTHVKTASSEMSVMDLDRLFAEQGISGAPVVDQGRLVGIVSRSDIVRQLDVEQSLGEIATNYYRDMYGIGASAQQEADEIGASMGERVQNLRVRDVMVRELITVGADADLQELATRMVERHVHRVLVTDDERLLGIVTTLELARLVMEGRLREA